MRFKNWLFESFAYDFLHGVSSVEEISLFYPLLENEDLAKQGYKLIMGKFPPYVGQKVWWKPGQKGVIPAEGSKPQYNANQQIGQNPQQVQAPGQPAIQRPQVQPQTQQPNVRQDLLDAGFRIITSKYPPFEGQRVYWKKGEKSIPVEEPEAAQQQQTPGTVKIDAPQPTSNPFDKKEKPAKIPPEKISEYQKAVEDTFLNTKDNITISALAGTGKTTLLRHLASYKKPNEKWLYLVFNKKNQVEASPGGDSPMPNGVEVKTSHSFLGNVLSMNSKSGNIEDSDLQSKGVKKVSDIIDHGDWFKRKATNELDVPWKLVWPLKMAVQKLANLAKNFTIDPNNTQKTFGLLEDLIGKYAMDTSLIEGMKNPPTHPKDYGYAIVELAYDVLRNSLPGTGMKPEHRNTRDHDDTLWWAALHADQLNWPHYDVILADEVQDFNKNQQIMLNKLQQSGARIIIVGDKNQSIYRFRGSDAGSFDTLQQSIGGKLHELPTNYRCGKNIIDYANRVTHVNNLKAGANFDGNVTEDKDYNHLMGELSDEWKTGQLKEPTAFISRTNKPLVNAALQLLKNNMRFVIMGKDLVDDLVKHLKKITGTGKYMENIPIEELGSRLAMFQREKEEEYRGQIKKQDDLSDIRDMSDALTQVLGFLQSNGWKDVNNPNGGPIQTTEQFIDYLKRTFSGIDPNDNEADYKKVKSLDPKKFVTLTTAHKSKGLEFDRVYLLRPDLFTSPRDKTEDDVLQSKNAFYVSLTRAKKELNIVQGKEP